MVGGVGTTLTLIRQRWPDLENPERLYVMGVAEVPEKKAPVGRCSNSPLLCELNQITASSQCSFVNRKINHSTGRGAAKEQHGGTPLHSA